MTKAGRRLIEAANEALAFARGEGDLTEFIVHAPQPTVDVKAIRKSMNLTQEAFGVHFGFGKARVRDWEQKRTTPAASDRVLLTTISYSPATVLEALRAGGVQMPTSAVKRTRRGAKAAAPRTVKKKQSVA